MSKAIENLTEAQKVAMSVRPKVGGFPYVAEALRRFGVSRNLWSLPACQSVYITKFGSVVQQGKPLLSGTGDIPEFDQDELIRALRLDQSGGSTFPEFLENSWAAGVIGYDVDLEKRKVTYFGAKGESYTEEYAAVELKGL